MDTAEKKGRKRSLFLSIYCNKGHYSLIKTGRKVWKRFKGKEGNKGGGEKETQRDHKSTPFKSVSRPAEREKKQNQQPTAYGCMIIIIILLKNTQHNLIQDVFRGNCI